MLSASKINLEIPMYNKSNSTSSSASRKSKMDMEIPVWEKATVPNDMGNYVAVMPLHQREAAQYFASQRKAPCRWSPRSGTWCQPRDADCAPSPHTSAESESTRGSDGHSTTDDSTSAEGNHASPQKDSPVDASTSMASKTRALVAELRDARLAAKARRLSLRWVKLAQRLAVANQREVSKKTITKALEERKYLEDCASALASGASADSSKDCVEAICSATAASDNIEVPFAVTVGTLDGNQHKIENLYSSMVLADFYKKVAKYFDIPGFAVKLLLDGRVLDLSLEHLPLHAAGLQEGSDLMLVKTFGAACPDLRQLGQFEKQWRGA